MPRRIFFGPIRAGIFASLRAARALALVLRILVIGITIYGALQHGFRGFFTALIVSGSIASIIRFLLGTHAQPMAPISTPTGRFQLLFAVSVILILFLSVYLGGWEKGWAWAPGMLTAVMILWVVGVRIYTTGKSTPGISTEIGNRLSTACFSRLEHGGAAPSMEEMSTLELLLDECEKSLLTLIVLIDHEADRTLLKKIYFEILTNGGDIHVDGNFLPAAALTNYHSLDFLLGNQERDIAWRIELIKGFFEGNSLPVVSAPSHKNDLLSEFDTKGDRNESIKSELRLIAYELAANHREGQLPAEPIRIELDHDDYNQGIQDLMRDIQEGKVAVPAAQGQKAGNNELRYAMALGGLLDLAYDNPATARVIHRHAATRSQLAELFETLHKRGANIWQDGNYLAASAIIHPDTLEFLLTRDKASNSYEYTRQVIRFFQGFPLHGSAGGKNREKPPATINHSTFTLLKMQELLAGGNAEEIIDRLEGKIDINSCETSDDLLYYLGSAYQIQGRYLEAEEVLVNAVESARLMQHMAKRAPLINTGGANRLSLIRNLAVLGGTRLALMDYAGAREALWNALTRARTLHLSPRIFQQVKTSLMQQITVILDALGEVYRALGQTGVAQLVYGGSYRHRLAYYGDPHPETARSMQKLGQVSLELGEYNKAGSLLTAAEKTFKESKLTNHPEYSRILFSLGRLHYEKGEHLKAETYYRALMSGSLQFYSVDNMRWVEALSSYATIYAAVNAPEPAFQFMQTAMAYLDDATHQSLLGGSERLRAAVLEACRNYLSMFASLAVSFHDTWPEAARQLFKISMRYKALNLHATQKQRQLLVKSGDKEMQKIYEALSELRINVAALMLQRSRMSDVTSSLRLQQLARRREQLEKQLARFNIAGANREFNGNDSLEMVAAAIPGGYIIVEYLQYTEFDYNAVRANGESHWKKTRYLAFVIESGGPETLRLVDIGDANSIDEDIAAFRSGVTGRIEDLNVPLETDSDNWFKEYPSTVELGRKLRRRLIDALNPGEHHGLLIAPDGNLARLPFAALPDESGKPLLSTERISYLTSARDLLRNSDGAEAALHTAVVAGDPDYWYKAAHTGLNDSNRNTFSPLGGTRKEAEKIGEILGVNPILGEAFTEGLIKECDSPLILHLATHGFFLPARKTRKGNVESAKNNSIGMAESSLAGFGATLEDPLLRSGLVLAGANTWLSGQKPGIDVQDGILTAEEVATLKLQRTEMTVLSACESGLGDIALGEGVLGLRHAFILAGSQSLVTCLWSVSDGKTSELMERFYRNLIQGMPRADALKSAQLSLYEAGAEMRHWAAFINVGALSPIEGFRRRCGLQKRLAELNTCIDKGQFTGMQPAACGELIDELVDANDMQSALALQRTFIKHLENNQDADRQHLADAQYKLSFLLHITGDYDAAKEAAERALALSVEAYGEDYETTIKAKNQLALTLSTFEQWDRVRRLREELFAYFQKEKGGDDVDTLLAEANLAEVIKEQGDLDTAFDIQGRIAESLKHLVGEDNNAYLTVLSNLSEISAMRGELVRARELQEKCLEKRRRLFGENHRQTIDSIDILSVFLSQLGDYAGALELKKKVYHWRRLNLGEEHFDTMQAAHILAVGYANGGDLARALELEKAVLERSSQIHGDTGLFSILVNQSYTELLNRKGDSQVEVYELRKSLLQRLKDRFGDTHIETLKCTELLAESRFAKGDIKGAIESLEFCLEQRLQAEEQDVAAIIANMSSLATFWQKGGEKNRSVEWAIRAADYAQMHSDNEKLVLKTRGNLAAALHNEGKYKESLELVQRIVEEQKRVFGEDSPEVIETINTMAATLVSLGRRHESITMQEQIAPLALKLLGLKNPTTLTILNLLSVNLLEEHQYKRALDILKMSVTLAANHYGAESEMTLREKIHLAIALTGSGHSDDAKRYIEEVARVRIKKHGKQHPDTH